MQTSLLENIVFAADLSSLLSSQLLTKELKDLELLRQYTLQDLSRRKILTRELLEDEDVIGFQNPAGISYLGATIVYHFLKKKQELKKDDFANVVDYLTLHNYFQINGKSFPEERVSAIIDKLESNGIIELKNWELAIEDLPKVLREIEGYIESREVLRLIPKVVEEFVEPSLERLKLELRQDITIPSTPLVIKSSALRDLTTAANDNQIPVTDLETKVAIAGAIATASVEVSSRDISSALARSVVPAENTNLTERIPLEKLDREYVTPEKAYKIIYQQGYNMHYGRTLTRAELDKHLLPNLQQYLSVNNQICFERKALLAEGKKYIKEEGKKTTARITLEENVESKSPFDDITARFDHATAAEFSRQNYQDMLLSLKTKADSVNAIHLMNQKSYRESLVKNVINTMLIDDGDNETLREREYLKLDKIQKYVKAAKGMPILPFIEEVTQLIIKLMFPFSEHEGRANAKARYTHLDQSLVETFADQAMDKAILAYVNGKRYTREHLFHYCIDRIIEEHVGVTAQRNDTELQTVTQQTNAGEKTIVSTHDHDYIFPTAAFDFIDAITARYTLQENYKIKGNIRLQKLIIPRLEKQEQILSRLAKFYVGVSYGETVQGGTGSKTGLKYHRMHILAATVEYLQENYNHVIIEEDILTTIAEYKPQLLEKPITNHNYEVSQSFMKEVGKRIDRLSAKPVTPRMVQERYPLKIDRDDIETFLGEYLDARGIGSFSKQEQIIEQVVKQYTPNVVKFQTDMLVYKTLRLLGELNEH